MSHLPSEALVAYFAGDGDDGAVEEHLFGCEACAREAGRIAEIAQALRGLIPPVIDRATLAALRARGLRIRENPVAPGARNEVDFPPGVDVLLHRLSGLDLSAVTQVAVSVRVESTGRTLLEIPDARFDRDAGEILIACQPHFAAMPPDTSMEVRLKAPSGERVERYSILHHYGTGRS